MSTELSQKPARRPDRAALAVAAVLIAVGGVIAWDASHLNAAVRYARIGPQTVPYVVAVGLAGLGLWTIIEALRGDFPEREPQEVRPVLWIVGGLLLQLLTIRTVGFSIATGLLFALVARGFGERRWWISVPAGVVISMLVWLLFARGLALTLPGGPLEHALSAALSALLTLVVPGSAA
ncbi:MAG: C4-dicarboxylate ABC transporter [Devosia sp. 67-54]|uniref:tripartite tricarboxylate transporter TctB family protein n=1 Tax=unclassified Devosia TaxID=196773 RepID=UPI00095C31D9|nr:MULTISPECIES: tripartite tricarboxylate transporter TctB family protein [unclassified Devosia]MBN9307274.1 tripartite tricarboxylate transporter TctB family protein [Devosia sp.]OJX19661.1 MAG: C4-dicarboxylate ABC transporter [Devosia sp. 67-54]